MKKITRGDKSRHEAGKEEIWENVIAILVVLVILLAIGWWAYNRVYEIKSPVQSQAVNIPVGASPAIGSENAKITVVIFSDFECQFCGEFARDQYPTIRARYIDTGKAKIVFKHFPLSQVHKQAEAAAEAAACAADQNRFWEYHDALFADQEHLDSLSLRTYAKYAGLDMVLFESCLTSGKGKVQVEADKIIGGRVGVAGTPTFFFNGRKASGALTAEEFGTELART
jgi:protein-disulfide isomerase